MITVLAAALALLCGVSVGIIIGILVCYAAWDRQQNNSTDPDYSGGI